MMFINLLSKLFSMLYKIAGSLMLMVLLFNSTSAQQKYGLLIGINEYYFSPDKPGEHSLSGCVNDALSVKSELINRYGFSENKITTLLDKNANMKNVKAAMNSLLASVKPGDAVVFYFSGHGMWMSNDNQRMVEFQRKHGMNQAAVLSDLYEDSLGCLLTDKKLKKFFNLLVKKEAVVTALFDCCYSGSMPASIAIGFKNGYYSGKTEGGEKSIQLRDLYQKYNQLYNEFTESLYKLDSANMPTNINDYYEYHFRQVLDEVKDPNEAEKSLKLSDAIKIHDPDYDTPPAELPGSKFLFMAAANDREKALDIIDESGKGHGAFTKALLEVIRKNPVNISSDELLEKMQRLIDRQGYNQHTQMLLSNQRKSGNWMGINSAAINNVLTVKLNSKNKNSLKINAGFLAGIEKGNELTDPKKRVALKVIASFEDSALVVQVKGNKSNLKKVTSVALSNQNKESSPLIKIYLPGADIEEQAFNQIVNKIMPLTNTNSYHDYKNFYSFEKADIYDLSLTPGKIPNLSAGNLSGLKPFYFFLPIPNQIIKPLTAVLSDIPSIQLVNMPEYADFILYLNYIKPEENTNETTYVFTYQKYLNIKDERIEFFTNHLELPAIELNKAAIINCVNKLKELSREMIRIDHHVEWINEKNAP